MGIDAPSGSVWRGYAPHLTDLLQRYLNDMVAASFGGELVRQGDFTLPWREDALVSADSLSWRVFKNPIALLVGGTAAVILELADPVVRAGIWEHTSFRKAPLNRLMRTGLAAMISVYGARSVAEAMIARVVRKHAAVKGVTTAGVSYSANDPRLLTWVHATASFGFAEAYSRYVQPLSAREFDTFYSEGSPVSLLYGASHSPCSIVEMEALFDSTRSRLAPSPIISEFLTILGATAILPKALRWMQPMLLRAAVELIPEPLRSVLGLTERHQLRRHERWLMKWVGVLADKTILQTSPAVQSCLRLGLPANYLYV